MNHDPNNLLVWLDLETTGLNPLRCSIIQMGLVVTDNDLNEIGHDEWLVSLPQDAYWEEGARLMHEATGLIDRVAQEGRPVNEVLTAALVKIGWYFPADFRPMLAGNSVHFDWRFLAYSSDGVFAELARRFFHRHYDASAVFECSRRTLKVAPRWSREKGAERPHTALADLRETLADMRLWVSDVRTSVPVSELAHVVNNALAPTGHAGERLAALIAECGATDEEKADMVRYLDRMTRGIGKVDAFVREKTRQPAFVPTVKAPTGGA